MTRNCHGAFPKKGAADGSRQPLMSRLGKLAGNWLPSWTWDRAPQPPPPMPPPSLLQTPLSSLRQPAHWPARQCSSASEATHPSVTCGPECAADGSRQPPMSGLGEFARNWLREAELGLELSRSRVRLGARVLILILQITQSTTVLVPTFKLQAH